MIGNNSTCSAIGILREIRSAWERRVALTPSGCSLLIEKGFKIVVQPSKIRCFSDDEYIERGCEIKDDLSECNLIVGVQEPDLNSLLENKTYIFFSHCKKGQTENQALLKNILQKNIRLIDYECIKEDIPDRTKAKRLVSFGFIAGIAGTINILKGIGELLLARQISTPFVFTKLAYMYADVDDALKSLSILGKYLKEQYLPEEYCPFTIAVLGNGQVSCGVQEALKYLPYKLLSPQELLEGNYEKRRDTIYVVILGPEDLYEKITDEIGAKKEFDKTEFLKSPENYTSVFESKYLSYLHVIINGLYWESRYPKILTTKQLKKHVTQHDIKLLGVSDISCDLDGSIELLKEYTGFRKPFFIYEPVLEKQIDNVDNSTKEGIIYHAIPNLAACFSVDASENFCNLLLPLLINLANSKYPVNFQDQNDLCNEIKNACICSNGVLTPTYRNIFRNTEQKKKVESYKDSQGISKQYFVSMKMKGPIFDSGFFIMLINNINEHGIGHKINFLQIGESYDLPSILYMDIFASTIDDIKAFLNLVKTKVEDNKLEFDIIKSNIS